MPAPRLRRLGPRPAADPLFAACAAAAAAVGICVGIFRLDARLAAEETAAAAAWPVGETVHSLARGGRSALLVMVHLDRRGRVLEASAFDPDDYA